MLHHVPNAEPKNRGRRKFVRGLDHTELPPDQSVALRERLLGEIAALQSTENATSWAQDGIISQEQPRSNGCQAGRGSICGEIVGIVRW